jgi:hypothetical protein
LRLFKVMTYPIVLCIATIRFQKVWGSRCARKTEREVTLCRDKHQSLECEDD